MASGKDSNDGFVLSTTDLMVGILFIFLILIFYFAYQNLKHLEDKKRWDSLPNDTKTLKKDLDRAKQEIKKKDTQIADLKKELEKLQKNQSELEKQIAELKDELQKAETRAADAERAKQALEQAYLAVDETRAKLLKRIRDKMKKRNFNVTIDEKRGILRLPAEVIFEQNEFELTNAGKKNINIMAEVLKKELPCYVKARNSQISSCSEVEHKIEAVFLEGHTDLTPVKNPSHKFRDNTELSTKRALASFEIINNFPSLANMKNKKGQFLFGVSGYGEKRPVCKEMTKECHGLNRRIDIRFVMQPPPEVEEIISEGIKN